MSAVPPSADRIAPDCAIAIYGGAFDPFHLAHLALARGVRDAFDVDVKLIPTGDPRHRDAAKTSAAHRVAMIRAAIEREPRIGIDTREIERSGASYTFDTLAELRSERGELFPLLLVLGADAFRGLPTWHRWRELIGLAHFVVVQRPNAALDDLPEELAQLFAARRSDDPAQFKRTPAGRIFVLPLPPLPQSSSAIRARIAAGEPLDGWVAPAVENYLREHRLYGTPLQ